MTERANRLRAELATLRDRQTHLGRVSDVFLRETERAELDQLPTRIASLEQAILEAENLSLTGDGEQRP